MRPEHNHHDGDQLPKAVHAAPEQGLTAIAVLATPHEALVFYVEPTQFRRLGAEGLHHANAAQRILNLLVHPGNALLAAGHRQPHAIVEMQRISDC